MLNRVYIFSSIISAIILNFCSFGQTPNTWTQKANLGGSARVYSVGFSIGSRGFIGTGISTSSELTDFWEYDTAFNAWTQRANFPGSGTNAGVGFSIGSKGYVGTGMGNGHLHNDFWEYDTTSNNWTQKAPVGGSKRFWAVGFSIGSKGYIGTGVDTNSSYLNDFWEYDPIVNTWTQKSNFGGAPRCSAVGFNIGSKGYIGTGDASGYTRDFWEYNPSTDSWTQKADFGGTPRWAAGGFSIGGKGYIGAGAAIGNSNDFWEYDNNNNTWSQKASFVYPQRQYPVGFSIGARGYLGTGIDIPSYRNDFWEYIPCASPQPPTNTTPVANQTICSGNNTVLSASGTGTLGWYSATTGGAWLGGGPNFTTPILTGDTAFYVQDSTCGASATRTRIAVVVNETLHVSVSITASANPVCTGVPVIFSATPTNGGGGSSFQWKVNGSNAGTNNSTFTYALLNNDQVQCILTSNISCPTGNPATSNTITMTILARPQGLLTDTTKVCGTTAILDAGSGFNSYLWNSGQTTQTISVQTGGLYTCEISNNTCSSIDTTFLDLTSVVIHPSDTTLCGIQPITLSATITGGNDYCSAMYFPANLQNGLQGYYPFCGNANDASINNRNGTVFGPQLANNRYGQINSAYYFNGNNQYIALPSSFTFINDLSISFWIKTNAVCNFSWPSDMFLIDRDICYSNPDWSIGMGDGGKIRFNTGTSSSDFPFYSTIDINDNQWHNIVIVKDGTENMRYIYIDGLLNTSSSFTGTFSNNNMPIFIGTSVCNTFSHIFFQGSMDDILFYNRVLTPSEIIQLNASTSFLWSTGSSASSISVTPISTASYWVRMNDGVMTCGDTMTITVEPTMPVSVSVTASANPVCTGVSVTYSATPTNGGYTPLYQWKVNGTNVGTNSATYSYFPVNNDAVTCVLTSNINCSIGNPATSNTVTMTVTTGSATITADYCNQNGNVVLSTGSYASYLWSTGDTSQTITINQPGIYTITTFDNLSCRSQGSIDVGTELVNNGEFSAGNTGFITDYTYNFINDGGYWITSNANMQHYAFFGMDHTNPGTGLFMSVNGFSIVPQWTVWQETVAVVPNTTYYFSFYTRSMNNFGAAVQANLRYSVNGTMLDTTGHIPPGINNPSGPFVWLRFSSSWNSGTDTSAILNITDLETNSWTNDFGLDDISFSTLPPRVHVISSNNTPICSGNTINLVANPTGGTYPLTYFWSGPGAFISTLQNPSLANAIPGMGGYYRVTVTDAQGCVAIDSTHVVVNPIPLPVITGPSNACSNSSGNIYRTQTGMTGYVWSVSAGGTITDGGNAISDTATIIWNTAGIQTVSVNYSNTNGCTAFSPTSYGVTITPSLPVSVSISVSNNPVCSGIPVTFTAIQENGGITPSYQWKVNGINAGTNNSTYSYTPNNNDIVTCIMTSDASCASGNPATSDSITMLFGSIPIVTFVPCFDTITTIGARPIKLKGGIPLGGIYSGSGVNSSTGIFDPTTAGFGTKVITYAYTNSALCTASNNLHIIVQSTPVFTCGNPLTDIRDNKLYPTILIGSQCWLASNLNYGTAITSSQDQRDNCVAEKYCYNDDPINCNNQGGLYQWDELMQYDDTPSDQGFCPPGWHIPTENDWNTLFANYGNNAFAGSPLKNSGYSGFNSLFSGARHVNSGWDFEGFATFFWSSTPYSDTQAWAHGLNVVDPSVSLYPSLRLNAFSVRCLQDYASMKN